MSSGCWVCTDEQYEEFFRSAPEFERLLVRSGVQPIRYWFSISDEERHLRFLGRIDDPLKQWSLSPMGLESRGRWEDYTRAKEIMLERTNIAEAPAIVLPPRERHEDCVRQPVRQDIVVPKVQ